jgi:hypothetical protein
MYSGNTIVVTVFTIHQNKKIEVATIANKCVCVCVTLVAALHSAHC